MEAKKLFVFNPEHDLALAVGSGSYTPPAEVIKLRKEKSLLPALFADNGDFILLPSQLSCNEVSKLPFFDITTSKNIEILTPEKLSEAGDKVYKVIPWGWDHAVRNFLRDYGISLSLLPNDEELEGIRSLSHRRTTIPIRKYISQYLNEEAYLLPHELFTLKEVEEFLKTYPVSYFKAPWSSSGRGITLSDHISEKGLMEWCHGIIRRQGSLIAEPAWNRIFDFATEWIIENNVPRFLGYSVFQTSSRGKYHGNSDAPQSELIEIIYQTLPSFSKNIIEAQRYALNQLIAPRYNGYLGIDMLGDSEGRINPCVEINLRLTMGHISILKK